MNSDSEDEEILSDIELTAEELAEAEASLAAKHAKSKSTGDIVVPIDVTTETKKVNISVWSSSVLYTPIVQLAQTT